MKKLVILIILLLFLSACSSSVFDNFREIEDLELIKTVGIDLEGDEILLTAEGAEEIYSSRGKTLSEAIHSLEYGSMTKDAFFSHTEHVVVGESLAQNGIGAVIDYISRDMKMRIDTGLFLAVGVSAEETVMHGESGTFAQMSKDVSETGAGTVFLCRDVSESMARYGCALIQAVTVSEEKVTPCGFGILCEDKLCDIIGEKESGYVTVLLNKRSGGVFTFGGETVSLLSSEAGVSYGDGVEIRVSLSFSTAESSGGSRFEAESEISDDMERGILGAIIHAQKLGYDYLEIGERAYRDSPIRFHGEYDLWAENFRNVKISVSAEAEIIESGGISEKRR